MSSKFIVFEGGEGCGKSTQARLLSDALGAVLTREPGGSEVGEKIRGLLLDCETVGLNARAEALMMAADRAQHVSEVIEPALRRGSHVVCDRFVGSSIAYQGYGREMELDKIRSLSNWATGGLSPDLVVLLDVPVRVAAERLARTLDRFEREDVSFHERVREGFLAQASEDPQGWVVLDGADPIEVVAHRVRSVVRERLQLSL